MVKAKFMRIFMSSFSPLGRCGYGFTGFGNVIDEVVRNHWYRKLSKTEALKIWSYVRCGIVSIREFPRMTFFNIKQKLKFKNVCSVGAQCNEYCKLNLLHYYLKF